jgi:hypothetical protein
MVGFERTGGYQMLFTLVVEFRQSMKRFRPMGVRSVNGVSVVGKEKALSTMAT